MDLSLFFEKYLLPKGVRLPRSKGNVAPSLFSSVAAATGGSFGPRKLHSKLPQISHFSYEDFLPLAARFPTMVCIAGINVGLGSLRRKEQLTGFWRPSPERIECHHVDYENGPFGPLPRFRSHI